MIGQPYTPRDCPRCHGEGEVTFNPSWPFDPQEETSELCRACKGTGKIERSRREPRNEVPEDHPDGHRPVGLDVAAGRGGSPVVLERQPLALTRVRALTTGLTLGSALGALTTLLAQAVTS